MRADGFLELVPQPQPYGPSLHVTPSAEHQLVQRWPKTLKRHEATMNFIAAKLSDLGVGHLERLTTALWVLREMPEASKGSKQNASTRSSPMSRLRRRLKRSRRLKA